MFNKLKQYIEEKKLFSRQDRILLAVSGGMDSMVMLDLFRQSNYHIGVSHCNFKLRPEADQEELMVRSYCESNRIPFYTTSFDTQKYADQHGISIQMAARDLRYEWFETIRFQEQFDKIATAHHQNDVAETMLINLAKGTGLAGLHGILPKLNQIIRPMLCFSRKDISDYVQLNAVPYLEDASNADPKYERNAIRLKLLPELEKINPAAISHMNKAAGFIHDAELILQQKVQDVFDHCTVLKDESIHFSIEKLKRLHPLMSYLFYLLKDYGFNETQIQDVVIALDDSSGKIFESDHYQLLKDREVLILSHKETLPIETQLVHTLEELAEAIAGYYQVLSTDQVTFSTSKNLAYLDLDRLSFPLEVRTWKQGDEFRPFGMKGVKKVSDFFIDEKIDLISKKKIKILCSGNEIVWLVGYRSDDRFRVTNDTRQVLVLDITAC